MKIIIFVFFMLGVICRARHIHPSNVMSDEILLQKISSLDSEPPIDVLNIKPTRFVPINSVFFFKTQEPCEDGFQRDALGICREVWDK